MPEYLDLLATLTGARRPEAPDPLATLGPTLRSTASDPLGLLLGSIPGGADPLETLLGVGRRTGGANPLDALFGGQRWGGVDPLDTLGGALARLPKPMRDRKATVENQQRKADEARARQQAQAQPSATGNSLTAQGYPQPLIGGPPQLAVPPPPGGDLSQQIVGMAVQQFGPHVAPVVQGLLAQEGGLSGAVGDRTPGTPGYHPLGSQGPLQFHPGGQLANFARDLGVPLETAAQIARDEPLRAAQWAFESYLRPALSSGLQGEALLREVIRAQNPGALQNPAHYQQYQQAYQHAVNVPLALAGEPQMAPTLAMASRARNYAFPVPGYQGRIAPHHGQAEARGGMDIMAPAGTPVVAMHGGRVTAVGVEGRGGGPGGNWVQVQGDDGLTYYYAHLQQAPAVRAGQPVPVGTPLGAVGNTGNARSTPPHLHIGIGHGIQTGVGPFGGLGRDFDALALLEEAYRYMTGQQ